MTLELHSSSLSQTCHDVITSWRPSNCDNRPRSSMRRSFQMTVSFRASEGKLASRSTSIDDGHLRPNPDWNGWQVGRGTDDVRPPSSVCSLGVWRHRRLSTSDYQHGPAWWCQCCCWWWWCRWWWHSGARVSSAQCRSRVSEVHRSGKSFGRGRQWKRPNDWGRMVGRSLIRYATRRSQCKTRTRDGHWLTSLNKWMNGWMDGWMKECLTWMSKLSDRMQKLDARVNNQFSSAWLPEEHAVTACKC